MHHTIYKICPEEMWFAAQDAGEFLGAPVDLSDGYIHFSAAHQVVETAAKHFAAARGLMLLAVDADQLGTRLKWETSRGGDLFPHLYGALAVTAVKRTWPLPLDDAGRHEFPDEIENASPEQSPGDG